MFAGCSFALLFALVVAADAFFYVCGEVLDVVLDLPVVFFCDVAPCLDGCAVEVGVVYDDAFAVGEVLADAFLLFFGDFFFLGFVEADVFVVEFVAEVVPVDSDGVGLVEFLFFGPGAFTGCWQSSGDFECLCHGAFLSGLFCGMVWLLASRCGKRGRGL